MGTRLKRIARDGAVTLRKSLFLEIAKKKTYKTFIASKDNFKTHFGII